MQNGALPSQSQQRQMFTLVRQRRVCTIAVVDSLGVNARVE